MNDRNSFFISTPLYYANDELHIGHAFTTLAADIASRFHKAIGSEVFFLTGSDEHGQKVLQAARAAGIEPLRHTDRLVSKYKDLWKTLHIEFDDFIRTTEPRHARAVQFVLGKLKEKGDIYQASYEGLYCTPCERFWTEKEVQEMNCPDCHRPVERIEEKNYFFRMSAYQEKLIEYIKTHPTFIRPENRQNEVLGFLAQPLGDLCISRPKKRLDWGIEIPFDPEYVTYVWFDALTNYISAPGYPFEMERFNRLWPASCHLIGKDILTTHAVYWSTMLMALGLPLPECVFAHGWWVQAGGKMSKSVGNVLKPLDLVGKYGLDPFRYYLFREMAFGNDAVFSEEGFVMRYNADLANDYGNLCQRMLPLLIKNRDGIFGKPGTRFPQTTEIAAMAMEVKSDYIDSMKSYMFHAALKRVWELISRLNKYFDETAPWKLAKEKDVEGLDEVFYVIGEGIRFASHLTRPFIPDTALKFMNQIGLGDTFTSINKLQWGELPAGTKCSEPSPIFPRIDTPRIESLKKGSSGKPSEAKGSADVSSNTIEYDEFMKVQLCVVTVESAEKVENADKLLKLKVNAGDESRTLVAGIASAYLPQDLVGKQVVMVKNLKPAKIRGILSEGMILAASTPDGGLAIMSPEKPVKPGVRVK